MNQPDIQPQKTRDRILEFLRLRKRGRRSSSTFGEIDMLRGIAIIMMVIYHFMFDLAFFGYSRQVFEVPFWDGFQKATASLFILTAGVSAVLAAQSGRLASLSLAQRWQSFAIRGGTVFGWGLVLSLITYLALGRDLYIRFGVLHLLGLSIAVSYPFLSRRWLALALGCILYFIGSLLEDRSFEGPITWLAWLGFASADSMAVDYFPFIRWFGVFLVGTFIGQTNYTGDRRPVTSRLLQAVPVSLLRQLGQRALPIYLLHQPILFVLLGVVTLVGIMVN